MSQAIMEVSDYLIEKANSPEALKFLLVISLVFIASFLLMLWNNQDAHNRAEENRRHREKMREFEGRGSDDY